MIRSSLVSSVVVLLAMSPGAARAQYGYPGGYGGYGWGGWGSTLQGSMARGLGYFNMGRGAYNYDTSIARSINTDTVMRWNQYAYLSHLEQTRNYHARLQAELARVNKAQAGIYDRLRNHPETRDITDGDALNVLLDILLNPATLGSSLRMIKTPLKPEVIRDIPFEVASEGMTLCLNQMTLNNEQWPLALRVEAFRPERERLKQAVSVALKEDEKGTIEPRTIEAVQAAIDQLRFKFEKLVPQSDPDYVPAQQTIKAMAGLTKMLYSPTLEQIIAELEDYQGTTVGDLLSFMQAFNLRFAPANSFRQRQIYMKLYPMLAELVNGSFGSGAEAAASSTVKNVENAGGAAVKTAEGLGSGAINGLKSAAVDFFKDMDWKHLSGSSKPTPPPPAPSQP
ncbi:MAG TPA: hypothetical protein VKA15_14035 [Isosphaeraceae bacterium]|nr:hypothetical protein [Isosphaeraceae bacterium]